MGVFKKLFGRKKNEIHMTPEEAYAKDNKPAGDAPKPEAEPAKNPKPIAEEAKAYLGEDADEATKARLEITLMYGTDKSEDGCVALRHTLRSFAPTICESEGVFTVTLPGGGSAEIIRSILPGVAGLPQPLQSALASATDGIKANIEKLNQKLVITPKRICGDFESEYINLAEAIKRDNKAISLYSGDRLIDCEGKLILDAEGNTELKEELNSDKVNEKLEDADVPNKAPVSDEELRRANSMTAIAEHGINLDCSAAVVPNPNDLHLRSVKETAERASALAAAALIARAYMSRGSVSPAGWSASLLSRYDTLYGVKLSFTSKENTYLRDPSSGRHAVNALKAEAAATLLWALGLFELDWPDSQTNATALNELFKQNDLNTLTQKARPRELSELLDMYDLTTRLHAMCVRAGLKELKQTGLDPDVIYERHYALNWYMGIGGPAAWDSIIPTT